MEKIWCAAAILSQGYSRRDGLFLLILKENKKINTKYLLNQKKNNFAP